MPCGNCGKEEKGIDDRKDYLCGKCTLTFAGTDAFKTQSFINRLLEEGEEERARFLERILLGKIHAKKHLQTPLTEPTILLKKRIITPATVVMKTRIK
jgi:hypothetical protein